MDTTSPRQNPLNGPLLVLGAAEERLHIVLGERNGEELDLLAAQEWVVPARAMGFLVPALEQIFSLLDVRPADLAGIACVRGPGSFTGIRIILATALGFMAGNNTPLAGLDHLHTLAVSAPPVQCATLAVLTYARRGQVYLQPFDAATRSPFSGPGSDLVALPAQQAAEALHAMPQPVIALGTGLRRNPDVFRQALEPGQMLPPEFDTPKADVLLRMASQADYARAPISPEYVRASDAEQNLEHIASLRGLSLEDARKRIDLSLEDMLQK